MNSQTNPFIVDKIEENSLQEENRVGNINPETINNFTSTLPSAQSDLAQSIIKDPYNLEFLDI